MSTKCVKCKTSIAEVKAFTSFYCQNCFQEMIYKRFRIEMTNVRKSPKTAVFFRYRWPCDRLLIRLLYISRKNRANSEQNFEIFSFEENEDDKRDTISYLEKYGLSCHFANFSLHFFQNVEHYKEFLTSSSSDEYREQLINILANVATILEAEKLGCHQLLLGDTCTKIASDLITNICLGMGEAVPWYLAREQSCRRPGNKEVTIVRPLRESSDQEVAKYLSFVDDILLPEAPSISDPLGSLISGFLKGLEDEALNVNTAVKTALRVSTAITRSPSPYSCAMCFVPFSVGDKLCNRCSVLLRNLETNRINLPNLQQ